MTNFQVFGLSVFGLLCLLSAARALRRREERWTQLTWLLLWFIGAAAVLEPEWTRDFANSLGVTRGADLVAYLTTFGLLGFSFWTYGRMRRTERLLTVLTREVALANARAEAQRASEPNLEGTEAESSQSLSRK